MLAEFQVPEWFDRAACKGSDSNNYFDGFYDLSMHQRNSLLQKCETCPVKRQCFNYAVDTKAWGIWAGKDFKNGRGISPTKKRRTRTAKEKAGV